MKSAQKLLYDITSDFLIADGHWKGLLKNDKSWEVLNGDSREILSGLASNSFDCIVTSPPYFWLRHYGVDNQIGLEETVNEYVDVISSVMDEVYRVLKPKGLLFLNLGDTYYSGKGQPKYDDAKAVKTIGLRAVDKSGGLDIGIQRKSMIGIPWRVAIENDKNVNGFCVAILFGIEKPLPEKVTDRPKRSYEHVFMFSKGREYFFNQEPLKIKDFDQDVWTIPARPKSNGLNTAPYPDELVKDVLKLAVLKAEKF